MSREQAKCSECGKMIQVTKSGTLRVHGPTIWTQGWDSNPKPCTGTPLK